jgi:hypothetical protein
MQAIPHGFKFSVFVLAVALALSGGVTEQA